MPAQQSALRADSEGSAGIDKPVVLIAEDNKTNLDVLRLYMADFDCRFLIAKNGKQAVALFRDYTIDLVLMDIMMPMMDGFEATKRIRRIESQKGAGQTPIIAVTAHVDPSDQHLCINAGMNDYLAKPIGKTNLVRAIKIWAPQVREAATVGGSDKPQTAATY